MPFDVNQKVKDPSPPSPVQPRLSLPLQIQDSANFFQLAQEKYAAIQQSKEDLRLPEQIQRSFSDLAASLRQAEEALVLPLLPTVQEIYTAEQRVSGTAGGQWNEEWE